MAKGESIVLYVEDEESDRLFMGLAFTKEGLGGVLRTVNDGQAALDYLSGTGPYADRAQYPLAGLVLLDLNLPEMHGFEVLKWIRAHPVHRDLPVVIFSSSSREEDMDRAQLLGANQFISKPSSATSFAEVARKVYDRWLAGSVVEKAKA